MAKAKQVAVEAEMPVTSIMDQSLARNAPLPIEEMPLNSYEDYQAYNLEARKLNKKLKMCRYPIKQCPVELHPHERIVFNRNDQPTNPIKVHLSNDKIHFDKKLYPGQTYDLPRVVVDYLSKKGTSKWDWFDNADGSRETRVSQMIPRFALRTVYQD